MTDTAPARDAETPADRSLEAMEGGRSDEWPGLAGFVRALTSIPAFAKLLFRLLGDPRVALLDKAVFAFTLLYLFVPVDLVPDWLPVMGGIDDLLVVLFSVDRLLHRTDPDVLLEHWDDDPEHLLSLVRLLDRVTAKLPSWTRRLLGAGP